jgi:hypothetical protein
MQGDTALEPHLLLRIREDAYDHEAGRRPARSRLLGAVVFMRVLPGVSGVVPSGGEPGLVVVAPAALIADEDRRR